MPAKKRKIIGSLEKLAQMREFMKPEIAYRTDYIAKMLKLRIENTRRYLRRLKRVGLIEEYRNYKIFGKYKFFAIIATSQSSQVTSSSVMTKEEKKKKLEVVKT